MKWSVKRLNEGPDFTARQAFSAATEDLTLDSEPNEISKRALDLKVSIHRALLDRINLAALEKLPREKIGSEIADIIGELLAERQEALNRAERESLVEDVLDELLGLGPLEPLLQDDSV